MLFDDEVLLSLLLSLEDDELLLAAALGAAPGSPLLRRGRLSLLLRYLEDERERKRPDDCPLELACDLLLWLRDVRVDRDPARELRADERPRLREDAGNADEP